MDHFLNDFQISNDTFSIQSNARLKSYCKSLEDRSEITLNEFPKTYQDLPISELINGISKTNKTAKLKIGKSKSANLLKLSNKSVKSFKSEPKFKSKAIISKSPGEKLKDLRVVLHKDDHLLKSHTVTLSSSKQNNSPVSCEDGVEVVEKPEIAIKIEPEPVQIAIKTEHSTLVEKAGNEDDDNYACTLTSRKGAEFVYVIRNEPGFILPNKMMVITPRTSIANLKLDEATMENIEMLNVKINEIRELYKSNTTSR